MTQDEIKQAILKGKMALAALAAMLLIALVKILEVFA